jgi:HlyD family secretion protein
MTTEFDCGRSMRRHAMMGIALGALLVGGVGGWAATVSFSGAVVAPGTLVVSSNLKKVQHPTGGVVGELRVRDGDRVKAGEVLARLDQTVTQANLAIVDKGLAEQFAKQARLVAEQDGATEIALPKLRQASFSGGAAQAIEGFDGALATEVKLMQVRRASREGQKAQLKERVAQLHEQIRGLQQQVEAKDREAKFLDQELVGIRELWQKKMIELGRLIPLERDASRLAGERGALVAEIAQARGRITETELQVLQVDADLRTEVGKEMADVRAKIAELVERKVAAEDQLARVEIRAPQDGVVHQLAIHTVGGVVSAGEPIMMIVPEADALEVETKVNPQDIDQVRSGQRAVLRFPAFNQRTTPEVDGTVSYVAADLTTDQKSGASFYTARVAIPADAMQRLGGAKLVPGMPVESFVQTTDRTVISYLTKPLMDQVNRAFRESR